MSDEATTSAEDGADVETEAGSSAAKSGRSKSSRKGAGADGSGDGSSSGAADVKNKADETAPEAEGTGAAESPQDFPEDMYTGDEVETEHAEDVADKFKSTLDKQTGATIGVENVRGGGRRESPADIGGTVTSDSEELA